MIAPALRWRATCLASAGVFLVLAVLVTQMDVFHRLLGTTDINLRQFGWALIPAVALLILWEAGKYIARRWLIHEPSISGNPA